MLLMSKYQGRLGLPISRTAFGELVAGAFLGSALFLITYRLQAGTWGARAFLASIPGFFFIASILAVNNGCDAREDRAAGRRTLAITLGAKTAALLLPSLGFIAFASTILLAVAGILPRFCGLFGAAAGLASILIYKKMLSRGLSHVSKSASMRGILGAFSLWSPSFIGGNLLGTVLGV